jgi:hypothetical protein
LNRPRGDEGSVTLYVVITALALFAALGLVADGGAATATKSRAIADAYAAARAGAQALARPALATTGTVTTDPAIARQAALDYLDSIGIQRGARVEVSGRQVRVTVTLTQPARILSMFGVHAFTVTGSGSASAVYGVQAAS